MTEEQRIAYLEGMGGLAPGTVHKATRGLQPPKRPEPTPQEVLRTIGQQAQGLQQQFQLYGLDPFLAGLLAVNLVMRSVSVGLDPTKPRQVSLKPEE